jgi:hypothetical protein
LAHITSRGNGAFKRLQERLGLREEERRKREKKTGKMTREEKIRKERTEEDRSGKRQKNK